MKNKTLFFENSCEVTEKKIEIKSHIRHIIDFVLMLIVKSLSNIALNYEVIWEQFLIYMIFFCVE